ncbi:methylated-DNA--[protein]-cysteine S-methyltransferase [Pseudosulfitobacter pseudonitzschiae]|uniref:methylated-DNA--[protein]-cysteine S-methyltransferase n=1 Tax=Pseudosulfitobacter pseudonitzschiae TaxID=1402135 RepID=UPI001AF64D9C|nr:methylated-DNA--[protein]-cysteine S-methyltransferase [Pseudosulfitobacter pseudonitzschiae]MBM1816843.1 methylated-DNA--[protein]-cysteine S-methyltransferase [Pseudosulfitobacter pseudonitzschiae]MBM1833654.1 methylated-DNA--[protein]-cysteine S-methyltransferase [Pseudosulfitobacter pseudonitzschiae]MBM1838520.1 methylated-DNA--[protein]-cysteine S-methyltransferase [Pseudosulfitobacter pseudonitzschiae]MBM1843571.1 methylated-DNA--[protein]-cysteine S-methyltransferase [Pseudosulfitobac
MTFATKNFDTEPHAADTLLFATAPCPLGRILVARGTKGVRAVLIGDRADALEADLAARFPKSRLLADDRAVRDDITKVVRFIEAPAKGLDLVLELNGTPFQHRVWDEVRKIGAGETVTYKELAARVGSPASPRAVAGACAANPAALAVPCHRVVRSDGALAGYRWGLDRKRQLLRNEVQI